MRLKDILYRGFRQVVVWKWCRQVKVDRGCGRDGRKGPGRFYGLEIKLLAM